MQVQSLENAMKATMAFKQCPESGKKILLEECIGFIASGLKASTSTGYNTWANSFQGSDIVRDIVLELYSYHRFPKRFEVEGVDPYTVPVKVVHVAGATPQIVNSVQDLPNMFWLNMSGFMADKHEGKLCLRLESAEAHKRMSA